jgi:glycosyltransferase involved in cell wall biosynthesis
MNVLFISDFNLNQNSGGAQVSNDAIIKKGIELGHNITTHNYDSSPLNFIYKYDLVISSNLEAINQYSRYIIDYIINHKNHVRLEHDSCSYLNDDLRKKLFTSSKINFFLSDFHISFFREFYGDYFTNVEIVYDPVNCSNISNEIKEKIYDITYAGFLHELKGCNNLYKFAQENPDRHINVFGWSEKKDVIERLSLFNNVTFHGKKNHSEILEIYAQSKYIYHNPIVNEPFCRMVAEALLCGCDFIGDKSKIGSIQEFEKSGYDKFSENCQNAAQIFWNKLTQHAIYEQSI